MRVREYGNGGPRVVLLHGGPGAPGYVAPVARGLAPWCRVLEPLQRGAGAEPLTVDRHVADLDALIEQRCTDEPPALVGHSWGAMLALAYAAAHPDRVRSLALIGCGTFDVVARERLHGTLDARMGTGIRTRLERLPQECPDDDERLARLGRLLLPLYSYDLRSNELELLACDARAYSESWQDMLRQQETGRFPAAFAAIRAPVLMLHGANDPHPGPLIRASLEPYLPRLRYHEWQSCGHYPWLERAVGDELFAVLRDWLVRGGVSR